jgi:hypothetical protein
LTSLVQVSLTSICVTKETFFLQHYNTISEFQNIHKLILQLKSKGARGGAVVEALRYKPEVRGIDSRLCQNFSLT